MNIFKLKDCFRNSLTSLPKVAKTQAETYQFTQQVLQISHVIKVYTFVGLRGIWMASLRLSTRVLGFFWHVVQDSYRNYKLLPVYRCLSIGLLAGIITSVGSREPLPIYTPKYLIEESLSWESPRSRYRIWRVSGNYLNSFQVLRGLVGQDLQCPHKPGKKFCRADWGHHMSFVITVYLRTACNIYTTICPDTYL